jgi:hypothetical protein
MRESCAQQYHYLSCSESQREIVTRLWLTFSNEQVVLGAINLVLDNGTAPMNIYWDQEAILSSYEDSESQRTSLH